jgi:hypothetical protein
MLGITVWLDRESIEVTGTIDPESGIVRTPSSFYFPLSEHIILGGIKISPRSKIAR